MVFRAGSGAMLCDIEFIDRKSANMFDARYIDIQNHLNIPDKLEAFSLPNGLTFSATSPEHYRVDYIGVDDTEIHLDFDGIHQPYDIHDPDIDPMARASTSDAIEHSGFGSAYSSHFDLTMRARGKIKVRGQAYDVDCLATNDHSWGPRPERGMRMMGYMNAHFDDDYVVQTIWEFDAARPDGEQHIFKHGYAIVDGKLRGGIAATLKHRSVVHRYRRPCAYADWHAKGLLQLGSLWMLPHGSFDDRVGGGRTDRRHRHADGGLSARHGHRRIPQRRYREDDDLVNRGKVAPTGEDCRVSSRQE